MALPFFRKDRSKPEPEPKPPGSEQHTTTLNPALTIGSDALLHGGIVVEEVGGGAADSAIGEAAILYASGQAENVETLLKSLLAETNPRIWHMLFDFYRIHRRQADFDRLALDYAMRFESSPPVWESGQRDPQKASKKETSRPLVLPVRLDQTISEKLGNILSSLDKSTTLQLDFSKVSEIYPEGAQGVSDMLATSRKRNLKFQVSGAGSMTDLLRSRMHSEPAIQAYWLMLMAIYQLLGKQTEFEDMAVDFAVAFELSPPSWENVQAAQEVAAPEPEMPKDAFSLTGVISDASQDQISRLIQYAQPRSDVVVDCSAVTRVDYAYIGHMIGELMQLLGSGKVLTLQGQNALVNELFCTMGIDQLANLVPAKLV
jgi:anti-anti-sigma regulatory factor